MPTKTFGECQDCPPQDWAILRWEILSTSFIRIAHLNYNIPKSGIYFHFGLILAARLTLLAPFFQIIFASSGASPFTLLGTESLERDPLRLKVRACACACARYCVLDYNCWYKWFNVGEMVNPILIKQLTSAFASKAFSSSSSLSRMAWISTFGFDPIYVYLGIIFLNRIETTTTTTTVVI